MICDLRVVAPEAYFQFPVAKYGLALDNWSIRRLTSLVGAGRARGMLLAAERLTADAALQTGHGQPASARWPTRRPGPPRSPGSRRWRCSTPSGCSTTTAPTRIRGPRTRNCSTGPGPARTSSRRRSRASRSGRRNSRAPDGVARGAALRLSGRHRCSAGGWVLRALQGAPAALGASPVEIDAVAQALAELSATACSSTSSRPPTISLDREEQRMLVRELIGSRDASRSRRAPIPLVDARDRRACRGADLAVSWYGHSSAMIEVDGYRVLADPVWSDAARRRSAVGPAADARGARAAGGAACHRRGAHQPRPLRPPRHRHHQSAGPHPARASSSCRWASARTCASGASPTSRIVELDWNESHQIGELTLVCTPGAALLRPVAHPQHHAVGVVGDHRAAAPRVLRRRHRLHQELRRNRRPTTALSTSRCCPSAPTTPAWPDIHMNPEEAVRAHLDVADAGSGLLVPIHWATFRLAPHPWAEPVERLLAAAEADGRPRGRAQAGPARRSRRRRVVRPVVAAVTG